MRDLSLSRAWISDARKYLINLWAKGQPEASVNDLFAAIDMGACPAPPSGAGLKNQGALMAAVFQGVDYLVATEKFVPGLNPASKGRKVRIWAFRPEGLPSTGKDADSLMEDGHSW